MKNLTSKLKQKLIETLKNKIILKKVLLTFVFLLLLSSIYATYVYFNVLVPEVRKSYSLLFFGNSVAATSSKKFPPVKPKISMDQDLEWVRPDSDTLVFKANLERKNSNYQLNQYHFSYNGANTIQLCVTPSENYPDSITFNYKDLMNNYNLFVTIVHNDIQISISNKDILDKKKLMEFVQVYVDEKLIKNFEENFNTYIIKASGHTIRFDFKSEGESYTISF